MSLSNQMGDAQLPAEMWQGQPAPSKLVCVGRNYAAHAAELNNPVPESPLLFIKPSTSLADLRQPLVLPTDFGEVHYEAELVVQIGQKLTRVDVMTAAAAISGVGLALDLTLRDLQTQLKQQGQPWEKAKAWDGACPVTPLLACPAGQDWSQLEFALWINGECKQQGKTAEMIYTVPELLSEISRYFTLLPGDLVLTGTPAGVGRLSSGDQLRLTLGSQLSLETSVR